MAEAEKCPWCGAQEHSSFECGRVKAIDFDRDMNIRRVEFLTPVDCGAPPQRQEPADEQPAYDKLKPMKGS